MSSTFALFAFSGTAVPLATNKTCKLIDCPLTRFREEGPVRDQAKLFNWKDGTSRIETHFRSGNPVLDRDFFGRNLVSEQSEC
jgi:hypothetical protein